MAKRNHDEAELIKAFAASRGKGIRWAQVHRAKESPEWFEFRDSRKVSAIAPKAGAVKEPGSADQAFVAALREMAVADETGLTPAQSDERRSLALWRANIRAAEVAALAGDVMAAVSFTRVAAETHKQYLAAKSEREKDDARRRAVIPAEEFDVYRRVLCQVAAIARSMDRELAARANPENPAFARAEISRWQRERWNPEIQALIEAAGKIAEGVVA